MEDVRRTEQNIATLVLGVQAFICAYAYINCAETSLAAWWIKDDVVTICKPTLSGSHYTVPVGEERERSRAMRGPPLGARPVETSFAFSRLNERREAPRAASHATRPPSLPTCAVARNRARGHRRARGRGR
eukprot:6819733-Prymnesium_polylepis.1